MRPTAATMLKMIKIAVFNKVHSSIIDITAFYMTHRCQQQQLLAQEVQEPKNWTRKNPLFENMVVAAGINYRQQSALTGHFQEQQENSSFVIPVFYAKSIEIKKTAMAKITGV